MMNEYMGDMAGRGTVQLPYPARQVTAEVTGDFTLPDYQPEIKKLLRIGVNLLPPDPHRGGSDLMGSMDYYVLYVGMDGGVYCAPPVHRIPPGATPRASGRRCPRRQRAHDLPLRPVPRGACGTGGGAPPPEHPLQDQGQSGNVRRIPFRARRGGSP